MDQYNAQAQPAGEGLSEQFKSGVAGISSGVKNAYESVTDGIAEGAEYVKGSIDSFGQPSLENGSEPSFLEANTLVAKFAFLVLVLIAFFFLVDLGIKIIGYFSQPKSNPYLISGTVNGASDIVISQNPKNTNSIPILRSNNQSGGMEFTWSVWLFVNDINANHVPRYQNVFNKGNGVYDASGIATVLNGPGLYIDNVKNQLVVVMNTVDPNRPYEILEIHDIPLRKWFHCTIRLTNTVLDVYINGSIAGRTTFQDVPKQNYEDVFVCKNGGFNGNLADLRYFNRSLSVFEINNIVVWGFNQKAASNVGSADAAGFPYYLSNLWYNPNY
jgi:hypothetical protein